MEGTIERTKQTIERTKRAIGFAKQKTVYDLLCDSESGCSKTRSKVIFGD